MLSKRPCELRDKDGANMPGLVITTDMDETQSMMECPGQATEVWKVYWGRSDSVQIVQEMVKELEHPDKSVKFPVHFAAFKGRLEDIAELVEEKPITPDYCQLTPLHCAALGGQSNVAQYLIERRLCTNVDIQDGGHHAPLHLSAWGGCRDATQVLLSHRANVSLGNKDGQTALHFAAFKGNREIVEDLISYHADVNRTDSMKRTPIHLAAMEGHTQVVQTLIDKAAKLDIGDARGRTPLHLAAGAGHVNTVKVLIANGAPQNFMSGDAWTPILFAAHEGKLDIVELLLDEGADVNIPNKDYRGYLLHGFSCRVNKLKDSEHELFVELFNRIVEATKPCNITATRATGSTVLDIILCCNNPSLLHNLLKGPMWQYLDRFPLNKPLHILSPEHITDSFSLHTTASFLVWKLPLTDLEKLSEKHLTEVISARNFLGQTVLHLLVMEQCNIERQAGKYKGRDVKKDCFCKMQFLIQKGLDMTDVDINGRTPFQLGWLSERNVDSMSTACPQCDNCVVHRVVKVIQNHLQDNLNEDGLKLQLGLLTKAIENLHQDGNELVQSFYSMEPYGQVNTSTKGKNQKIWKAVNTLVHNILKSVEAEDSRFQCEQRISGSMAEGTKTGRMDEVDFVLLLKSLEKTLHITKDTVAQSTAIMTPHGLEEFTFTDSENNQCLRGRSYIARLNQLIMQAITGEQLQLEDSVLSIDDYTRRLGFVSTLYITWYDKDDDAKLHGHKVAVDLLPALPFHPWIVVMQARYFDNRTVGGVAVRNAKELSSVLEDRKLLHSFDKDSFRGYHIAKMVLNLFQDVTFTIENKNRKAQDFIQSYLLKSCLFWLVDNKDNFEQYYPGLWKPKKKVGSRHAMLNYTVADIVYHPPMSRYTAADIVDQPPVSSYIAADIVDQPPMPSNIEADSADQISEMSLEDARNARIWAVQIFQLLNDILDAGYTVRNYFLPNQLVEVRNKAITQQLCKTCLVILGKKDIPNIC